MEKHTEEYGKAYGGIAEGKRSFGRCGSRPAGGRGNFVVGGSHANAPAGGGAKPVPNAAPKVGRNDPCPCGSGKKYKNCCGKEQ